MGNNGVKKEVVIAPARIAMQVADANAQPGRNAHFALDVIAIDPKM